MITNFILTIIITIINIVFNIITPLFPVIDTTQINLYIDKFFDIITVGLDGLHFIVGDFPFTIAPIILSIYLFYYTIFIPVKLILKVFIH